MKNKNNNNTGVNEVRNVENDNIAEFLTECIKLKPKSLILPDLIWKFAVRNVIRGENILFRGMSGSAKTLTAHCLVEALKRPFFSIPLGSTQDPRASLIGNTNFNKEKGTYFSESYFVQAIQTPNAMILLDELSRAHPEAWNILMPVLDQTQRFMRLEEKENSPTIKVAQGVSFVATANVGSEYTSTRVLDRALNDRFTIVDIPSLSTDDEYELLKMKFPKVNDELLKNVANICSQTRKEVNTENSVIQNCLSTRTAVKIASLLNDGFTLTETAEVAIYPFFSNSGGADSERTYVKQLIQKYIGEKSDKPLFDEKEVKADENSNDDDN